MRKERSGKGGGRRGSERGPNPSLQNNKGLDETFFLSHVYIPSEASGHPYKPAAVWSRGRNSAVGLWVISYSPYI